MATCAFADLTILLKINMGVLMKNEQFNEDMTDICMFLNQYIPGDAESMDKPPKVLSGGDYLTFERHKQAQSAKRNSWNPRQRMEGLVPKMEEFHNQAEFLQASSKDVVHQTCQEAFLYRNRRKVPDTVITHIATAFDTKQDEARKLLLSLGALLKSAVFQGSTAPADLVKLFPSDFHKNLRDLLAKIIIENMTTWRAQAVNNQVSLPQMVDFDWRVDIKTSSDSIARMSVPTCILQMKVQENPDRVDMVPDVTNVNVELSKETLDTMLDGLSKIRDQLSSVANR